MSDHQRFMQRALQLAQQGAGHVEPNPQVGCVLVKSGQIIGEGWHQKYGGPHAEANALATAGDAAQGCTAYVTLEPCCHTGKTPPCANALIQAGVAYVVVAVADPFPQVSGGGIARLEAAGIKCEVGIEATAARRLLAPYLRLIEQGRPWIVAKWAMTLDGKIATRTGSSQWISSPESRAIGHGLRSRMDAVLVGRRTALADDPTLTARLDNKQLEQAQSLPRIATRIVLGEPLPDGNLIKTIDQAPLLVVVRSEAEEQEAAWVADAGGEVLCIEATTNRERLTHLMEELGRRRMTKLLIEGGAGVLGAAFDAGLVDEVHAFIAPKIVGGQPAPSPVAGEGIDQMKLATQLTEVEIQQVAGDVYLQGRVQK